MIRRTTAPPARDVQVFPEEVWLACDSADRPGQAGTAVPSARVDHGPASTASIRTDVVGAAWPVKSTRAPKGWEGRRDTNTRRREPRPGVVARWRLRTWPTRGMHVEAT